jgi:gamma-glutamyltranspeptidase/glutathione hydrolase
VATRAACASDGRIVHVVREALGTGNAVDAVVAGVLAAVAESPSVLLGPVQLLVGGAGAGLRALDGRVRQPGLGVPRPRGVRAGEPVPAEACVGVPALPATIATALASAGSQTLLRVAGPAIEAARALSPERAAVLQMVGRRGAAALVDDAFVVELLAVAGRAAGGTLTQKDLAAVRPGVASCDERSLPAGMLLVPWRTAPAPDGSSSQVVAAVDGRGLAAVACYEAPPEGLAVPALGLVAPLFAAPVRRGEARVRPGEPRPAAAPIALRAQAGRVDLALGVAQTADAEGALDAVIERLGEPTVAGAVSAAPAGRVVALVRTREAALVVASA